MAKRAVVLLSGGMDSAVVLAWMVREGFDCIALSFDYGQRHRGELECARRIAASAGVREHLIQRIDLRAVGASALTADIDVPKDRDGLAIHNEIPVTYVPARNTLFLSFALALAEARGASAIAIGVNAIDYSGYPDCRGEFLAAFSTLANLATRDGVAAAATGARAFQIHAPLIDLTKSQIVQLGSELGVDFAATTSCYDPTPAGIACGHCDACILRARGFAHAGQVDPVRGANQM
ncbi:MAG: 7-cyano-7-deazaguanine synthase QueC [Phycisphaerales bacterium]|nr:7-cyano-7-deazaguanine synthase QueC [Phycisphaerales bacterium]